MDTTYIKMSDCPEIQGLKEQHYLHKSAMGKVVHGLKGTFFWGKPTEEIVSPFAGPMPLAIWLPTQEELQEMIGDYNALLEYWKKITWHWWHDEDGEFHNSNIDIKKYLGKFTSMNQLWLAFAMKENHNKTWNGNEWL